MLQIFGYRCEYDYGMECGVVIAEDIDEAMKMIGDVAFNVNIVFTPISNEKGITIIGDYEE